MLLNTALVLLQAFGKCPYCGEDMITPGKELSLEHTHFTRNCSCGWAIEITVQEIMPGKDSTAMEEVKAPDPYETPEQLPEPCRGCWQNCDVWERSVCQVLNPEADPLDL